MPMTTSSSSPSTPSTKLAKYRGKEGVPPKINKLGSGAWNKMKERTKSKLKDIARDLIRLYAARKDEKAMPLP